MYQNTFTLPHKQLSFSCLPALQWVWSSLEISPWTLKFLWAAGESHKSFLLKLKSKWTWSSPLLLHTCSRIRSQKPAGAHSDVKAHYYHSCYEISTSSAVFKIALDLKLSADGGRKFCTRGCNSSTMIQESWSIPPKLSLSDCALSQMED